MGTGWAWAGHNRAKLWPWCLSKENTFESEEKLGAFSPTGSATKTEIMNLLSIILGSFVSDT